MNIVEAFAGTLEPIIGATLGQNLFISRGPTETDSIWWLRLESSISGSRLFTGELQQPVTINVYFRSQSANLVYDNLINLNTALQDISEISDYVISSIETTGPFVDQDLDIDERLIGMLQVTINLYKENTNVS